MKVLIQRCNYGKIKINQMIHVEIEKGYVLFVGIHEDDTSEIVKKVVDKLIHLRLLEDENQKINCSILDKKLPVLSISQYSLYADYRKGRRPSFTKNASLEKAKRLYAEFNLQLSQYLEVKTGVFQADMKIELENDGPFTLLIDSEELRS